MFSITIGYEKWDHINIHFLLSNSPSDTHSQFTTLVILFKIEIILVLMEMEDIHWWKINGFIFGFPSCSSQIVFSSLRKILSRITYDSWRQKRGIFLVYHGESHEVICYLNSDSFRLRCLKWSYRSLHYECYGMVLKLTVSRKFLKIIYVLIRKFVNIRYVLIRKFVKIRYVLLNLLKCCFHIYNNLMWDSLQFYVSFWAYRADILNLIIWV